VSKGPMAFTWKQCSILSASMLSRSALVESITPAMLNRYCKSETKGDEKAKKSDLVCVLLQVYPCGLRREGFFNISRAGRKVR
jgi:hypothetical protein